MMGFIDDDDLESRGIILFFEAVEDRLDRSNGDVGEARSVRPSLLELDCLPQSLITARPCT